MLPTRVCIHLHPFPSCPQKRVSRGHVSGLLPCGPWVSACAGMTNKPVKIPEFWRSVHALVRRQVEAGVRFVQSSGFAAQRLMELEVENLIGAAHGGRSPERINHCNGYRDRDWETRAGTVERCIPS
jgi:hypothetical protein